MKPRYILAREATRDLAEIWRYLNKKSGRETADRVESVIRGKFAYLASFPGAGHRRQDLTSAEVLFLSVYSYLIVYRSETKPLQIVSILHGSRDVAEILTERL